GPRARFTVLTSTTPALAHNCGYQGGAAAFRAFADVYRLDLGKLAEQARKTIPPEVLAEAKDFYRFAVEKKFHRGMPEHIFVVCESLKRLWRAAHPRTVELWSACSNAFRSALDTPNVNFHAGHRVIYRRSGNWMYARLPSGRILCYPQPRVEEDGTLSFMGINQYTRKWERLKTFAGRLAENITQAAARDVITTSMPVAEHHGYEIVLTVHDELVTEAPDSDEFNADHLAAIMSDSTGWRQGLPLAAAGYEGYRYRKD
ncbi:MAG TPA: DNA polymerase I, partial [Moraxellaceae bacterium]|nr:DNA polymerase I [Moraxellaceae bacterium]